MKKLIWKIKEWFRILFKLIKMFDLVFSDLRAMDSRIQAINKELEEVKNKCDRWITADKVFFSRNLRFDKYGREIGKKYLHLEHRPIEEVLVALFEHLGIVPDVTIEKIKMEQVDERLKFVFKEEKKKRKAKSG